MVSVSGDGPKAIPRPTWLAARARNAIQRPIFIGAVGIAAFVAALVALVLTPQEARRARAASPLLVERPDTAPIIAAMRQARTRLGAAEASLALARATPPPPPATIDTLSPILNARRDSLTTILNDLTALLDRAQTAPLAASYRALGESPQLLSNPRARALLDSLSEVERDRDGFGDSGGADPVSVALTSRATEIGREIEALGEDRRDALRRDIAKLSSTSNSQQQIASTTRATDTASWIAERDSARSMLRAAVSDLVDARTRVTEYERELARSRAAAAVSAPAIALLASALIVGVVLGFGSALLGELRRPTVGDEHEVERVTGARVLATIRPRQPNPERGRRLADRDSPRYFDPASDAYQLTYLHVARAGANRMTLTVAAADTAIAAVVAMNLAAIAADEARTTIVVDTDARTSPVAAALRARATPGVMDILDARAEWAEATTEASIGRDRVIDVIPSGVPRGRNTLSDVAELFRREFGRLARYYEAIVLVASTEQAAAGLPGALPIADTIICAHVGHTRMSDLQLALENIRLARGNPIGVVLWDADTPTFPTPETHANAPRGESTREKRTLSRSG